ncbi:MAG TPA: TIGR03435 family protein [Bryobacteraceae bacterium]|nr:TIGR03435 family protein [Bryobacteraceae bacterium]
MGCFRCLSPPAQMRTTSPVIFLISVMLLSAAPGHCQPRMEFEAAAIKPSRLGGRPHSNFPLGGEAYVSTGGLFIATNFSIAGYIFFAYKIDGNQAQSVVPQLPRWVMEDHFDIQARASGNPTKNEMRLMMKTLLADRLNFRTHTEVRTVSVLGLVLSKPGTLGSGLKRSAARACPSSTAPAVEGVAPDTYFNAVAGGLPMLCNQVVGMPTSDPRHIRAGARNVSLEFIANYLSGEGTFGRPIVDATGLTGTYDFAIEWAPQGTPPPGSDFKPEPLGTTFEEAIHDQLGLKLKAMQRPLDIIVIDHIERPSEN